MCLAHQGSSASRSENSWCALITQLLNHGKPRQALTLYHKMHEDSIHPTDRTFVSLLKACTKLKDVESGVAIHRTVAQLGLLDVNLFVGATLVDMYAKCGLLSQAQEVHSKLLARDVVSWNALISGYCDHKRGEDALECFRQMQLEDLSPNAVTFVGILKACGSLRSTEKGCEIHADIMRKGLLEESLFIGNSLVDMYARCGLLSRAKEVYDTLPGKDVVSCNALISGYVEHGDGQNALKCFESMDSEGISPNAISYICSLKACGYEGTQAKGSEIHVEIARRGILQKDLAVGNALVDMYAKCGSLDKAREVFDQLPSHDVISCNVLITGYAEHGYGEEALNCIKHVKRLGVTPDAVTFMCSLKACGNEGLVDEGQKIHSEIVKMGLMESDLALGNSLVDMYSKCGWCAEAEVVFMKLQMRDLVSWNAILACLVEHDHSEVALEGFDQMQLEGVLPDALTFVSVLKACGRTKATEIGQGVHVEVMRRGLLDEDPFVGSALVNMYLKCTSPMSAQEVFEKLLARDSVLWNALISGYIDHELHKEALHCFEEMLVEGVYSDPVTLMHVLKVCGCVGAIKRGQCVHMEIAKRGLSEGNIGIGNTLVDMYSKCGNLVDARRVLDRLEVQDVVSWSALISGYAHVGRNEDVFLTLNSMVGHGLRPDAVTFISILKACSHGALFDKGQTIYNDMVNHYGIVPTREHRNCMVDLLSRSGQIDRAMTMIKGIPVDSSHVMWDSLLGACKKWGNVDVGIQAFENLTSLEADDAGPYVSMSSIFAMGLD